ncbi:hypothetical protein OG723_37585 [Streptomyces sp. NBC_01278]|uniref:hypothetical protein n=1 Tax=Streptomyces sp. NBC_01278 TaxID=2903809 RepID=UPI002E33619E|nr:hypothetical protein [Streptomyces sp. NBC_01278]
MDITGASTATPKVDCSQPQDVKFEGKLTGTGTGDVTIVWQGDNKRSSPVVKFTAPTSVTPSFTVKSTARAAATDPAPKVRVILGDMSTGGGAADSFTFTLTCQ